MPVMRTPQMPGKAKRKQTKRKIAELRQPAPSESPEPPQIVHDEAKAADWRAQFVRAARSQAIMMAREQGIEVQQISEKPDIFPEFSAVFASGEVTIRVHCGWKPNLKEGYPAEPRMEIASTLCTDQFHVAETYQKVFTAALNYCKYLLQFMREYMQVNMVRREPTST